MCGIVGVVGSDIDDRDALVARMGEIAHRGPDGDGQFHNVDAAFGMHRLAIRDLTHTGMNRRRVNAATSSVFRAKRPATAGWASLGGSVTGGSSDNARTCHPAVGAKAIVRRNQIRLLPASTT